MQRINVWKMRCKWERSKKLKDEILIYFLVECVLFGGLYVLKLWIVGEKTTKKFHIKEIKKKLKKKVKKKKKKN